MAIAGVVWLTGVAAALLSLRWTFTPRPRFWPATLAALAALMVGYVGLTRFQMTASKTVNGVTQWRFDSKWFFAALLVLAASALACVVWKRFMPGRRSAILP